MKLAGDKNFPPECTEPCSGHMQSTTSASDDQDTSKNRIIVEEASLLLCTGLSTPPITRETHTFRTKLTLACIAPFFSRIMHGAVHCRLHSPRRLATRFAWNVNSLAVAKAWERQCNCVIADSICMRQVTII